MAESTSPSLSRSPNKLEYASCIDTTLPLPTIISNYHSSFDYLSEPRDYDRLMFINQKITTSSTHRTLDRTLNQLNLNANQSKIDAKKKALTRTESISLPATPTEQFSPPLSLSSDHQYHQSISEKNQLDEDEDEEEEESTAATATVITEDIDDDEQQFHSSSPPDYMNTITENDCNRTSIDDSISTPKG